MIENSNLSSETSNSDFFIGRPWLTQNLNRVAKSIVIDYTSKSNLECFYLRESAASPIDENGNQNIFASAGADGEQLILYDFNFKLIQKVPLTNKKPSAILKIAPYASDKAFFIDATSSIGSLNISGKLMIVDLEHKNILNVAKDITNIKKIWVLGNTLWALTSNNLLYYEDYNRILNGYSLKLALSIQDNILGVAWNNSIENPEYFAITTNTSTFVSKIDLTSKTLKNAYTISDTKLTYSETAPDGSLWVKDKNGIIALVNIANLGTNKDIFHYPLDTKYNILGRRESLEKSTFIPLSSTNVLFDNFRLYIGLLDQPSASFPVYEGEKLDVYNYISKNLISVSSNLLSLANESDEDCTLVDIDNCTSVNTIESSESFNLDFSMNKQTNDISESLSLKISYENTKKETITNDCNTCICGGPPTNNQGIRYYYSKISSSQASTYLFQLDNITNPGKYSPTNWNAVVSDIKMELYNLVSVLSFWEKFQTITHLKETVNKEALDYIHSYLDLPTQVTIENNNGNVDPLVVAGSIMKVGTCVADVISYFIPQASLVSKGFALVGSILGAISTSKAESITVNVEDTHFKLNMEYSEILGRMSKLFVTTLDEIGASIVTSASDLGKLVQSGNIIRNGYWDISDNAVSSYMQNYRKQCCITYMQAFMPLITALYMSDGYLLIPDNEGKWRYRGAYYPAHTTNGYFEYCTILERVKENTNTFLGKDVNTLLVKELGVNMPDIFEEKNGWQSIKLYQEW